MKVDKEQTERLITERNLVEHVAAGLRCMKTRPDFFLVFDPDFPCDSGQVCGIKVLYGNNIYTASSADLPITPVWLGPIFYNPDVKRFEEGWEGYKP